MDLYGFVGNQPVSRIDLLGQIIHTECPIREWLDQYLSSYTETPTASFEYSSAIKKGNALTDLIVERMVNSAKKFIPKLPDQPANAQKNVDARVAIVNAAQAATGNDAGYPDPPQMGCAAAALKVFTDPGESLAVRPVGMAPGHETLGGNRQEHPNTHLAAATHVCTAISLLVPWLHLRRDCQSVVVALFWLGRASNSGGRVAQDLLCVGNTGGRYRRVRWWSCSTTQSQW